MKQKPKNYRTKYGTNLIYKEVPFYVKEVDEEQRVVTAIASKEVVDRDGDIVKISGINLKHFKENGPLLWAHDHTTPAIGTVERIWKKNGDELWFKPRYASPNIHSLADTVYGLTKDGIIKAFSIGFQPDWEAAEPNEKTGGWIFHKSSLMEISSVNVPSNPEALVQSKDFKKAVEKGIIDEVELKEFELYLEKSCAKENEKEEIDEKNKDFEQINNKTVINNNKKSFECKSCGTEIKCLCKKCQEEQEEKEFFEFLDKIFGV